MLLRPALTVAEKCVQAADDRLACIEEDRIDLHAAQLPLQRFALLPAMSGVTGQKHAASGIDGHSVAAFGIDQIEQPGAGKLAVERVTDMDEHELVADVEQLHAALVLRAEQVGQEKDDRLALLRAAQERERRVDVRLPPALPEREDFVQNDERMGAALAGRDVGLDPVGEDEQPHHVVVLHGAEGEDRRHFGGQLLLQPSAAEEHGAGAVEHQHQDALALLGEHLDVKIVLVR